MTENSDSFPQRIFSKTPLGTQEMASRSLGLTPLQRRVLILLDGKRSLADVAVLVPGHDVAACLRAEGRGAFAAHARMRTRGIQADKKASSSGQKHPEALQAPAHPLKQEKR